MKIELRNCRTPSALLAELVILMNRFVLTSVNKKFKLSICSDRILTFVIRSIRSPAKVGLVITKLLTTSPVVSWRGWETPPAQLSFFAQPPLRKDLSLRGVLPSSSATVFTLMVDWCLFDYLLEYFPSNSSFKLCQGITNLSWGGESEMRCIPVLFGQGSPPLALGVGAKYVHAT